MKMALIFLVMFSSASFSYADFNQGPNTTVPFVDLEKYSGLWFEIAAIPQSFQKVCTGNTTAEYAPLTDGTIEVINSCDTKNGRKVTLGNAKVFDRNTNSQLIVAFLNVFNRWVYALGGTYWVVDLDKDYQWAVVGSPGKNFSWILARTAEGPDRQTLKEIAARLTKKGYNTCKLKMSPQQGRNLDRLPLCTFVK